ncbi:MAG: molybdopterin-guanine dinucleotide biosynthesis protein B [Bacillota bacterium]
MVPIISVVGKSKVGKTTLLEKLLPEIKKRGYRVAVIKHDVHGFDIDRPGKDTWKHARAGADIVVISSPQKMAIIEKVDREKTLAEIASKLDHVDLIITEGYKRQDKPKIEVFRSEVSDTLLCKREELIAVATNVPLNIGVPEFDLDDSAGIVGFIQEKFLKSK